MKRPLSVIFAGTPEFAVPALKALINDPNITVKMVITQPDMPVGRKQQVLPTPVKIAAQEAGIDVLQPKDINTAYPTIDHDFLVVVAYGQLVKQHVLDAPKVAALNVHASLLPRWRGASPMQHSILHGDKTTGVTIQRMVRKLDAGPILGQVVHNVRTQETIKTLHDTLSTLGTDLLLHILKNTPQEIEQDDAGVTLCHKLSRETGNVDPKTMDAATMNRAVRALVPWPGVRCHVLGEEVKLLETSLEPKDGSIELSCKNSVLHIVSLQPSGKKPMSGTDFMRGRT
ncbi:methionyl-tRNA formyltransferase [Candidatus Peregrinibacteria bacterium CG10_big_fil_rev_8_21_14_0_10_42_8]|nr:MAG: methionyl-tRNA formyltransferase [Candidatus Peregrinibacteria bacterium CG10_big_fil_rev_8_21_14_0_10_42_8]